MGDGTTSVIILGENLHPPQSYASFSNFPSRYASLDRCLFPSAIGIARLHSAQSEGGLASVVGRVDIHLSVCLQPVRCSMLHSLSWRRISTRQ